MAAHKVDELVRQIEALDRGELEELLRGVERTFSLSAETGREKPVAEPSYSLRMLSCGPHRGGVIRLLREHFGCSLYLARRFADGEELLLTKSGPMSERDAERELRPLLDELAALGAEVAWSFDWGDCE